MAVIRPQMGNWRGQLTGASLVRGATPSARYEYLTALAERVSAACLTPYASTALAGSMQASAGSGHRYCAQRVNIGTSSMRGYYSRAGSRTGNISTYGDTSSGSGSADEIVVSDEGGEAIATRIVKGSELYGESPSEAQDRLFEADTTLTAPYSEVFRVGNCDGFTVYPHLVQDLSTI